MVWIRWTTLCESLSSPLFLKKCPEYLIIKIHLFTHCFGRELQKWGQVDSFKAYGLTFFAAESLCGPAQINLTDTYLLNVSIRDHRAQDCVWLVSNNPGSVTYIDILNDVFTKGGTFKVGRGRYSENPSSVIHELDRSLRKGGTSLLVIETNLWIRAAWTESFSLNGSLEVRIRSQNYSNNEEGNVFFPFKLKQVFGKKIQPKKY